MPLGLLVTLVASPSCLQGFIDETFACCALWLTWPWSRLDYWYSLLHRLTKHYRCSRHYVKCSEAVSGRNSQSAFKHVVSKKELAEFRCSNTICRHLWHFSTQFSSISDRPHGQIIYVSLSLTLSV